MEKVVAVEENLTNVKQALQSAGYKTVQLKNEGSLSGVGAVVVSGGEQNFLGIQDTESQIPVINADGRSAAEVVSQVQDRIS